MEDFRFSNIDSFFSELRKENNDYNKLNLRLLMKDATAELNSKFGSMTLSEKLFNANRITIIVDNILNLDSLNIEQVDFLNSFRTNVSVYTTSPKKKLYQYSNIFKNRTSFDFFHNALDCLNIIDQKGGPKRGFQAGANAIFQNHLFKTDIFRNNLKLTEFIVFLKDCYNAPIKSIDKLSDGSKYENEVNKYFTDND